MNEQVSLINTRSSGNSFNRIDSEIIKTVFCTEKSIQQKEFFETASRGFRAEYMLEIWDQDYNGEMTAQYNGKRYTIYRTYKRQDDMREIYLASEG